MGGRQGDPASYRSKLVFVYVHVAVHFLSVYIVCVVDVFVSVWERNSLLIHGESRFVRSERGVGTSPTWGVDMSQPHP